MNENEKMGLAVVFIHERVPVILWLNVVEPGLPTSSFCFLQRNTTISMLSFMLNGSLQCFLPCKYLML